MEQILLIGVFALCIALGGVFVKGMDRFIEYLVRPDQDSAPARGEQEIQETHFSFQEKAGQAARGKKRAKKAGGKKDRAAGQTAAAVSGRAAGAAAATSIFFGKADGARGNRDGGAASMEKPRIGLRSHAREKIDLFAEEKQAGESVHAELNASEPLDKNELRDKVINKAVRQINIGTARPTQVQLR